MKKLKDFFQNLQFVRKIQIGFFLLGMVSAIIAVNDYLQMTSLKADSRKIFSEFVYPEHEIARIYSEFQKIQFDLLKLSNKNSANDFSIIYSEYQRTRADVDKSLKAIEPALKNLGFESNFKEILSTWNNYKSVVADAIVSAVSTKNYDYASIITISVGKDAGDKLIANFDKITSAMKTKSKEIESAIISDVNAAKTRIIIGMFIGSIIFLIAVFVLSPAISKPITRMLEVIKEFARGNYEVHLQIDSHDEFGELADALRNLREKQKEKIFAAKEIAKGNFVHVEPASEKDELAFAFNKEVEVFEELVAETKNIIEANKEGNLDVRVNSEKFEGGWRQFVEGINGIVDAIVVPLNEAGRVLRELAQGNLNVKVEGQFKGSYKKMMDDIDAVINSLRKTVNQLMKSTKALRTAVSEITSSSEELAAGAEHQSQQVSEIAGATEEMAKTILDNTQHTNTIAKSAEEAGKKARDGGEIFNETFEGIHRIDEIVEKAADAIRTLGNSSKEIGEIVKVINDIAEQTNLLALNAAIEAARAGEQGRGFAVVADEVRKLAEKTTRATKEIETMIKNIQEDTKGAVESIEEGSDEVKKDMELAKKADESIKDIIENVTKVSEVINYLASASEEQSSTSEQISKSIENINSVAQQTAEGSRRISQAAGELYDLTENFLEQVVNYFKIDTLDEHLTDTVNGSNYYVGTNGKLH